MPLTKNYDYDVQKLYLENLMDDVDIFIKCQGIFDPTLFDKKLKEPAEFILEYTKQYSTMPDYKTVNAICRINLSSPEKTNDNHKEWVLDEFESFVRHKALERAILKSADLLEKNEYGTVESLIKEAVQIGLTRDLGVSYWHNPRMRLEAMRNKNSQVKTGYSFLDKKLYGGMERGTLNVIAGGSGSGKSLFLANFGLNWSLDQLNVVYITCELSQELVGLRLDAMVSGMTTKQVFSNIDQIELVISTTGKKAGSLYIKYIPSGKTVNDIRAYIKELETKTEKKTDIIIIDYLDLLMPASRKINPSDLFVKDKYVSEELRNLAVETHTVLLTASQLNRQSVEEVEFDHSHISGGLSKIQTADNVFGIFTSRAMQERGLYQLQLMKTRSSSGVGQKIDLAYNIETMRITDIPEEEQASGVSSVNDTSSIIESIKRKSDNKAKETQSAEVESAKLREMINSLNTEDEF